MRKKKINDLLAIFSHFQKKIFNNRPPFEVMIEEVRMMKFRIRPLDGDVSRINFNNEQLIEALWNLGKVDEFFQKEYLSFSPEQKKIFFRFIDEIYQRFHEQLNKVQLKNDRLQNALSLVEMEIFKEKPLRVN